MNFLILITRTRDSNRLNNFPKELIKEHLRKEIRQKVVSEKSFYVKSYFEGIIIFVTMGRARGSMQHLEDNWEVVVAQLTEWSFPIPEDPGSNTIIGNFY